MSCIYFISIPSSISKFFDVGTPSSSIVNEPLLLIIVPSSNTFTPLEATLSPILFEYSDVPFLLKSPSNPCPTASCNITPGQPWPRTTGNSPAGAGLASKFKIANLNASLTFLFQFFSSIHSSYKDLPP